MILGDSSLGFVSLGTSEAATGGGSIKTASGSSSLAFTSNSTAKRDRKALGSSGLIATVTSTARRERKGVGSAGIAFATTASAKRIRSAVASSSSAFTTSLSLPGLFIVSVQSNLSITTACAAYKSGNIGVEGALGEMSSLTPTTELEAVNQMLELVGEAPVNTLTNTQLENVQIAKQVLKNCSRKCQSYGWHFNTEEDFPITPDSSTNYIVVPSNTLRIDTSGRSKDVDVTYRGNRIYDKYNHTYEFENTLYFNIVYFLPFDEIPEAARSYIAIKAAREYQVRVLGSEQMHGFTESEEAQAWQILKEAEQDTGDYNIFNQNYNMFKSTHR